MENLIKYLTVTLDKYTLLSMVNATRNLTL